MTSIDTRIQMLNLRAPDEATGQRISTLVEEAIRMAALDADIPASVFVVRQLDLSSLPRAAPPAVLAHAIDVAVERVVANAVAAEDPGASAAPMVYFKNDNSVVLALAQRIASNRPSAEWFWPAVVKDWPPSAPVERAIPLLVERALATSGGVVTLARVVEMLAATGVIDKLLERLSPSDGRALLRAIGWTEAMVSGAAHEPERAAAQTVHVAQHSEPLVERWIGRWGGDARDPRALWLGAMLLVADRPERATNPELPASVKVWLAAVLEQSREAGGDDVRDNAAARAMHREDLIADARAWLQSHPRSPVDSLFGGAPRNSGR